MNQAILFNDDLTLVEPGLWQVSGFYQGELIQIRIYSRVMQITEQIKFDWEMIIEDWLEQHEPVPVIEIRID